MKRLISLVLLILLFGCGQKEQPKLYVFVNETCGECQQLKTNFLPKLNAQTIEIIILDIDNKGTIDRYKDVLKRLNNIDLMLNTEPITPFIYLEGSFGAVGYHKVMDDIYLQLIDEAIHHKEFSIVPSGVYVEKGD